MIFSRPWLPLLVAGCLFSGMAEAQDNAGGASPGAGAGGSSAGSPAAGSSATGSPAAGAPAAGGASSAFGAAPSAPSAGAIPNAPNQAATPNGTQNPNAPNQGTQGQATPGTGTGTGPGAAGGQESTTPGGSASAFGSAEKPGGSQLQQAPASFHVPGFYGRGPQTFTVGEGRLARPRFRFSGNISAGYDDNVFATPTHAMAVPAQKLQVQETEGTPATQVQVLVPSGDPNVPATLQTMQIPAVAPKFRTVTIPGVPAAQRIASWVTRTDGKFDMQFANRKTLFTFDLGAGVDYYWDRPGKKEDYTGNVSMVYLRKLSGRAQFTFSVDSSYQSQPDFSQPNVPTSPNVGSYLSSNVKADLSYRLTPRFSAVTSLTYNTLQHVEATQTSGDYASTTIGTELRYLFSPRLTLVGELRYSVDKHADSPAQDTSTYYLLTGGDIQLSKRFNATFRLGEAVQTFTETSVKDSAPFGEMSLGYRFSPATLLNWNARYGYEEAGAPNTREIVARTGLQLTQIFTPRLQAVASLNLVRTSTTSTGVASSTSTTANGGSTTSGSAGSSTTASTTSAANTTGAAGATGATGAAATAGTTASTATPTSSASSTSSTNSSNANATTTSNSTSSVQDTIDASLGFYYTLSRHWSFNLTYSYTAGYGPETSADYFRQHIFLGGSYQF